MCYAVLACVSTSCPPLRGRLLTRYSPVRRSVYQKASFPAASLDLHVLGTPPAFVLSQDQTLYKNCIKTNFIVRYNLVSIALGDCCVFLDILGLKSMLKVLVKNLHFCVLLFNFQRPPSHKRLLYSITLFRLCQVLFSFSFIFSLTL